MSKFLIVPGLPKSGTTFLYSQLSAQTGNFNIPSDRKEIDYFRRGQSIDEYKKLFASNDERKVYLDCSPQYADDIDRNSEHIKNCLEGHEVQIVFCMRNPFERMYSHYLHDIAQNFQIMGQAPHSIYMPSVMSRYIYPLASRVEHYIEKFGHENVHGFSFENQSSSTEKIIRVYADLPENWAFDYSKNPSPGFTSPTTYYSNDSDLTIEISGSLYVLPKNDMLVANRQFSTLHRHISPQIGNNIMKNIAFIDREFDGSKFKESADIIWNDYEKALELLNMDVNVDRAETVFSSKVSSSVPEGVLSKLKCVGTVDTVIKEIFSNPRRSSANAIINSIEPTVSLSSLMARLDPSAKAANTDGLTPAHYLECIIQQYGPSPYYLELLLKNWLRTGNGKSVIEFMEKHPKSAGLFRPVQIKTYIDDYKKTVSNDEYEKILTLCG